MHFPLSTIFEIFKDREDKIGNLVVSFRAPLSRKPSCWQQSKNHRAADSLGVAFPSDMVSAANMIAITTLFGVL